MKKDVHFHQACFENWKEKVLDSGIEGISKVNSKLIMDYIFDMEKGENVARGSKKGARGYGGLNVNRLKLIQTAKMLERQKIKDMSKVTQKQIHKLFDDLYKGRIVREIDGKPYKLVADFITRYKSFWHWWMKINKKEGKKVEDICEDLEMRKAAVNFVYFTKEHLDRMMPYFTPDEQVLALFLFDTIIRFPTECLSLRVSDIYNKEGEVWVNIPDEVSKTFGRTFNLIYSGPEILKYIKNKKKDDDEYLFDLKNYQMMGFNKKLKQVALQVLANGNKEKISHPKANGKFSELTGYDFRHSGAIHLRVLAHKNNSVSLDAIRHRAGWSDFGMLNYYTQFLGLTGEIKKEALLIEEDKAKIIRDMEKMKRDLIRTSKLAKLLLDEKFGKISEEELIKQVRDN